MKKALDLPDLCLLIAVPVALFLAFYHLAILDPYNFGWALRGTDNGENILGLHAWLNDPATGWSLRSTTLNAPDGVALLFTDSNPLLAILTAPIARTLGPEVQFIGPWILACLLLQAWFARALLKPHAPSRLTLWFGVALLMLLPTLYARYIHVNLQAHWLILWALWIFVDDRRVRDTRWWVAILAVTALVHNYLLLIVAAVWGTAMLKNFIVAQTLRERLAAAGGAIFAACTTAFIISRLGISSDFVSTGEYGALGMPLDGLWNPSNSSYSMLLPATDQHLPLAFEGFQFLGAGLLLLLLLSWPVILRTEASAPIASLNQTLVWLIPACIVITALALTHQIAWGGRILVELPLDPTLIALLDPVRASGRLFWLVSYVLVFAAIIAAYRLTPPRATQLLGFTLALQIIDMTGMMVAIRQVTAEAATHDPWQRTRDARWQSVIASATDVTFAPPTPRADLAVFQEVAWRAVSAGKPVRMVYASRNTRATDARLAAEQADFVAGRLVPDRLYVLFPSAAVPAGAKKRLLILDGVRLLVPLKTSP